MNKKDLNINIFDKFSSKQKNKLFDKYNFMTVNFKISRKKLKIFKTSICLKKVLRFSIQFENYP